MITLYSTGCPKCKILEQKLNSCNIPYEKNDDVNYMLSIGIEEVPVIEINGNFFNFLYCNSRLNELGENAFKDEEVII